MPLGRNILDIYKEHRVMPNVALHMLRVASVAKMIVDNLVSSVEVDERTLVATCLVHDIGSIVKFNLEYFPEALVPEGLEYWQSVQNDAKKKYGAEEHEATENLLKEIGVGNDILNLLAQMRFALLCQHTSVDTPLELKILHYADYRVSPKGIVSYRERMAEAGERYKSRVFPKAGNSREELVSCGAEIEKQIFAVCKIKPEDINDESVKTLIQELKGYSI